LIIFLFLVGPVRGADVGPFPERLGGPDSSPTEVLLSFETSGRWDDNLFLKSDPVRDFQMSVRPGAAWALRSGIHSRVRMSGELDARRYARRRELDAVDHRTAVEGETGKGLFFARLLGTDILARDRVFASFSDLVRRRDRSLIATAGFKRNVDEASLTVGRLTRDYQAEADASDRSIWRFTALLRRNSGRFTWHTRAEAERYDYGGSNRDGMSTEAVAGVNVSDLGAWTLLTEGGMKRRTLDGPSLTSASCPIGSLGMSWSSGPRLKVSATVEADVAEADAEPESGTLRDKRGSVEVLYRVGPRATLSAARWAARQSYRRIDGLDRRKDDVRNSTLRATYRILPHMDLWMEGRWDRRDSSRPLQDYDASVISTGVRIEMTR
jgi:hypothetical protein